MAFVPLVLTPARDYFAESWDVQLMELKDEVREVEVEPANPAPIMVPRGTINLALHTPVTSRDKEDPVIGKLEQITDGEKDYRPEIVELSPGSQWIQIDLGARSAVWAVAIWHGDQNPVSYGGIIVQLSNDPQFKMGVRTIFNNDRENAAGLGHGADRRYVADPRWGKLIRASGTEGRYIRIHINGSTRDDCGQFSEIEVYGVPAGSGG